MIVHFCATSASAVSDRRSTFGGTNKGGGSMKTATSLTVLTFTRGDKEQHSPGDV